MARKTGTPLEFTPYEGLGPVRFGMTRAQVKTALGAPDEVEEDDIMEQIREKRGPIEYFYDWNKKRLNQLTIRMPAAVMLKGKSLFEDAAALSFAESLDSTGKEGGGYRNFPKLGMLMGGFGRKRIPEGKLIMLYDESMKQEMANMTEV